LKLRFNRQRESTRGACAADLRVQRRYGPRLACRFAARKRFGDFDLPLLGAHMSIAGGYYKAVEDAARLGMDTVQLFTKNNNQWRAKEITDEDAARFRSAMRRLKIKSPIAHDSYLINLGSPDDTLWNRSIEAFCVELLRAEKLGIRYVVAHPGAYVDSTETQGIDRIAAALDVVHRQTPDIKAGSLLENTAGQGSSLGWKLEHLAAIIAKVAEPRRLGVCIDTCHLFAAGYPLTTRDEYESTIGQIQRTVGLSRVKAFHLNDSKKPLGSRVDRHEHIGKGHLGLEPFRHLLNDPRFARTPMYLETAKETVDGEEMDAVNLRVLRGLCARKKGHH
jgi:deoxyribonuclease-4